MQDARARLRTLGIKEGEGRDSANARSDFEQRRAPPVGINMRVLDKGTVVDTLVHERLVIADLL